MENRVLLRALRKLIHGARLEPVEDCIFEQWTVSTSSKWGIFEKAGDDPAKVWIDGQIGGLRDTGGVYRLFEALFTASKVASSNERRQLPLFEDPKKDMASLETSKGLLKAHYELRELDDLIPSHDPINQFGKREDYPEGVQERPYHSDSGEQDKVRRNAANLNPRYLLNTNPDAMSGPPVISPSGVVLGGNSRTMSMQLASAAYPDKAEAYKEMLIDLAETFGFAPAQVRKMKRPTLVRVVSKTMDNEEMAQASRIFNEVTTQALQLDAEGVSKSKLVSAETVATIREDLQDFDTLREYLGDTKSKALVEALVKDGVIEQMQLSRITRDDGLLNSEGKELVEATLRGLIVQDYDAIRKSPASIIDKIDRAIPALSQLKGRGEDWDLSEVVTKALTQIQKALAGGLDLKTLPGYFGQVPIVPDPERSHKGIQVMALTLANASGKEFAARLAAMAQESAKSTKGVMSLVAQPEASAEKTFAKAFLRPLAVVGGKSVPDFRPETDPKHAAIQWAYNATRTHKIEDAIALIEKSFEDGPASPEDMELMRERMKHLAKFEGQIVIYTPRLGDYFNYSSAKGDSLTLQTKRG